MFLNRWVIPTVPFVVFIVLPIPTTVTVAEYAIISKTYTPPSLSRHDHHCTFMG